MVSLHHEVAHNGSNEATSFYTSSVCFCKYSTGKSHDLYMYFYLFLKILNVYLNFYADIYFI